jgi:hypothetical protein
MKKKKIDRPQKTFEKKVRIFSSSVLCNNNKKILSRRKKKKKREN